MDIHKIVSNASDKAMKSMFDEFLENRSTSNEYLDKVFQNLKSSDPKMYDKVEDYKLMMKYCNYLVEHALEEYSKHSK